jgi:tripartite-type tricarboxylate transporter receptor subunit TctC
MIAPDRGAIHMHRNCNKNPLTQFTASTGPLRWRLACALAVALAFAPLAATAQQPDFAGKPISILTSGSAGGGYDMYARLVSRHIGRFLAGNPTSTVKNVVGAGGFAAATRLYAIEPKDGTSFGIFQDTVAFAPLLESAATKLNYDPLKFSWLGTLDSFVPTVISMTGSPFGTLEDIQQKEMTVASTGAGSTSFFYPKFLNAYLGTKLRIIAGYPGTPEVAMALERGEVEGYTAWCWSCIKVQRPEWYQMRKITVLLQLSMDGDPELNSWGVRTLRDVLKTDEQKQAAAILFGGLQLARPFAAPPNVPEPTLKLLREAFTAMARDKLFLEDAEKGSMPILYGDHKQIEAALNKAYAASPEALGRLRKATE